MKRFAAAALALTALSTPALAGNVEAAVMDPKVIEAAAASSSSEGLLLMGFMITAILLATLSNGSSPT